KNPDDVSGTGGGVPTQEQLDRVVALHGDATHTVEGVAAGPHVEGGIDPLHPSGGHSPLVTDPSPEATSTLGTTGTTPTFHNPSEGLARHQGDGGHTDYESQSGADTTASALDTSPPLEVQASAPVDDGGDAVHTFAAGFLADSPDDGGLAMPDVVDHSAALAP